MPPTTKLGRPRKHYSWDLVSGINNASGYNQKTKVPITKFSQKTYSGGKTVAMSIGAPRLTANGKRIGRPPGTFKNQREDHDKDKEILARPTTCRWNSCNKEFYTVESVVSHVHNHVKEKECVCRWDGCGLRVFKSYYMLVSHLRCHTGERPQKCDYPGCTKAYKTKENLVTHKRTHTGEKPFKCQFTDVCDKHFTNASDRGKHENRCHSSKKDYYCDIGECYKRYTDPSSLRKHVICSHGKEFLEKRTKIKVRWVYRRDGLPANSEQVTEEKKENKDLETETKNLDVPVSSLSLSSPIVNENQTLSFPPIQETPLRGKQLPGSAFSPVIPRVAASLNPFMMSPTNPALMNPMNNPSAMMLQYLSNQATILPPCSPLLFGMPQPFINQPIQQFMTSLPSPTQFIPQMTLFPPQLGLNSNETIQMNTFENSQFCVLNSPLSQDFLLF